MGEYEPRDSRNVTNVDGHAPGEPPRTGPREGSTRPEAERGSTTSDGKVRLTEEEEARRQGISPASQPLPEGK